MAEDRAEGAQAERPRGRQRTEDALIEAVGTLLEREGFAALGVNALAREAGADKVLIYRYFGSLDGLYRAFAQRRDLWPSARELLEGLPPDGARDPAVFLAFAFGRLADALRTRAATLEILVWELSERNALTAALERAREEAGEGLMRAFVDRFGMPAVDMAAFASLQSAAIEYLALRARRGRAYNRLDLRSDPGWRRIVEAVAVSAAAVFTLTEREGSA